ncbi:MAG: DUF262 domain-containing protein [Flavipsychrobacter sp.]|nr:DUF262 domain-containing protein [Flavipsychrobacter sp.]
MSAINFNTSNQTYRQLMGNGLVYNVPRFQRDYSWTDEEWDDLWADIQGLFLTDSEPAHYMGYLVLQSKDNKRFDIIDGQQRLTTLSIFTLAILKNFDNLISEGVDPENNSKRKEQLRGSFIGYLDPVSLIPQSKLTLNRNNNSFYQHHLVPLQKLPIRGLKYTEHQMRKAFEWFENRIKQEYSNKKDGAVLAKLLDQLSDRLFFTVITVTDELNAYKVFETLNARGVKLSSTDLLKNYLFSVVHREVNDDRELNILDERWEILVGKLGSESFPDFLRAHWNSRNKLVRSSDLFKTIRAKVLNRQQVFELIREMEEDADPYVALSRPEDSLWNTEQGEFIEELRMFNVRQLYPLLLSGYRRLSEPDFTILLKACSVISFRYNVIGNLPTNEQERVYTAISEQLHNRKVTSIQEILQSLRSIYPDDNSFYNSFSEKQLKTAQSRNKRIVRYILFKIEKLFSGNNHDMDSDQYNIEHILPEFPENDWSQFNDRDHESFIYRIGNMTLMNSNENRDIGNAAFDVKKNTYVKSVFAITRKIAEDNSDWTMERIAHRQKWMANQAKTIWRINQIS